MTGFMSALLDSVGHYGEPAERHFGVYAGVVTDNRDPEAKGRVKINLPWIDSNFETLWAPVSQIYAGDGYGTYWIPEVGDQVIVSFMRGELRKPVVMGAIYSEQMRPELALGSGQDPKVLRTRSGHMLLLEEGSEPLIRLVDQTGDNEITINSTENSITVRASADVVVKAGGNVEVEAGGSASVSASGNLELKAGGSITIEASGALTISGATVAIN